MFCCCLQYPDCLELHGTGFEIRYEAIVPTSPTALVSQDNIVSPAHERLISKKPSSHYPSPIGDEKFGPKGVKERLFFGEVDIGPGVDGLKVNGDVMGAMENKENFTVPRTPVQKTPVAPRGAGSRTPYSGRQTDGAGKEVRNGRQKSPGAKKRLHQLTSLNGSGQFSAQTVTSIY